MRKMRMRLGSVIPLCRLAAMSLCLAAACVAADLTPREWTVNGVKREALVYAPNTAKTTAAPIVFMWHGHGGTMRHSAWAFPIHAKWKEAIVVHPQGLPTPSPLVDPEGKRPGWQQKRGEQDDRDLRFFDTMLASLKTEYKVDDKNIFCTGYSNGGMMTFLLWSERPGTFRAFAPCACVALPGVPLTVPKPAFFLMGEKDELVKPEWMRMSVSRLKTLNRCGEGEGKPWGTPRATLFPSSANAPLVVLTHPGGHTIPPGGKTEEIVRFFKESIGRP
ncbi:MAG: esterase [Kiritimatiellaeota bacterium]|nr:esterase [Kiritimatiellota bacterium]